jgi:hypothetical protein
MAVSTVVSEFVQICVLMFRYHYLNLYKMFKMIFLEDHQVAPKLEENSDLKDPGDFSELWPCR